jgi:hypothetical protein
MSLRGVRKGSKRERQYEHVQGSKGRSRMGKAQLQRAVENKKR